MRSVLRFTASPLRETTAGRSCRLQVASVRGRWPGGKGRALALRRDLRTVRMLALGACLGEGALGAEARHDLAGEELEGAAGLGVVQATEIERAVDAGDAER